MTGKVLLPHSVMVNSPQTERRTEWKSSAIRIFGAVALILGSCIAALYFLVWSLDYRPWITGLHLIGNLLLILLAANLMYIGWHAMSRGTIPIHPQPPFRWHDISNTRAALASMSVSNRSIGAAVLFAACAALGAQVAISHSNWVNDLYYGRISGVDAAIMLHGRSVDSLRKVERLIWLIEFPVSLSAAIVAAMALGAIRIRPATKVGSAVGYLFLGSLATVAVAASVGFCLIITGLLYLWFVGCIAAVPIAAIFLSVSRSVLIGNQQSELKQTPAQRWAAHFLRTAMIVGLPGGLILGYILALLTQNPGWIVPGIEIAWAALYGASLVQADRNIVTLVP